MPSSSIAFHAGSQLPSPVIEVARESIPLLVVILDLPNDLDAIVTGTDPKIICRAIFGKKAQPFQAFAVAKVTP
jgi:hypothetical protein